MAYHGDDDIGKSLEEEFRQAMRSQDFSIKPRYQTFTLPPPPEEYLLTFIGGPKNATQVFTKRKEHPTLRDGQPYRFVELPPWEDPRKPVETFDYTMTFIPLSQTPFTDAQCVVAVFIL